MAIFEQSNTNKATGGSDLTVRLTMQCTDLANELYTKITTNEEWTTEYIIPILQDHDKLDRFIAEQAPFDETEFEWLVETDSGLVDRMIKSQQSKRSRSKGKQMTQQTVHAILVGAYAENVLRKVCNKPKNQLAASIGSVVEYTPEQLAELQADQDNLRRHIRNLQSRASIMKSKIGFDENDPKYVSLLDWQERLKELRVGAIAAPRANPAVVEMLKDKDFNNMKPTEAKELLAQIYALSQS
jgi:hypothetical protein